MILLGRKFCQEHFRYLDIFPQNAYFVRKWVKFEIWARIILILENCTRYLNPTHPCTECNDQDQVIWEKR